MADNITANKSQNKAFLDQLDRQRANKPCIRIIDLRGKVAGECQAYTFGDRTHYLDDRAYLITKKLLDRYDGRYTMGVYDTLMMALKKLTEISEQESEYQEDKSGLNFKRLPFDHQSDRKELRIIYATPITINIGDVRYSATTMNLTTSAIKVSLKRAHTLEKNGTVFIDFLELSSPEDGGLLSNVKFKILRIDHTELRTQLVLVRNKLENTTLTDWFNQWSIEHNAGEHLDLDNELFNIMMGYYLRLYCTSLTSSLYWLSNINDLEPIKAFHHSENADNSLHLLLNYQHKLNLSPLPFKQLMTDKCDYLLLLTTENGDPKRYIARRDNTSAVSQLLHHQIQSQDSVLILLKTRDLSISIESYEQELHQIASIDADYSNSLQQRLSDMSLIVSVTNITPSLQNMIPVENNIKPTESQPDPGPKTPFPTYLRHHIQYHEQRFLIKTKIRLYYSDQEKILDITTTDVSNEGLSFSTNERIDVKIGDDVQIDFSYWQKQSPKSKLSKLPFIVRNIRSIPNEFRIGFERNKKQCHPNTNTFFIKTIEHNKEKLFENNHDLFLSQEAKIFSSLLSQNLSNIPFYLAVDSDGKRVFQAVSTTKLNKSHELTGLWQSLQPHVIIISGLLHDLSNKADHHSVSFGLYCHQDKLGIWQVKTDYDIKTVAQKAFVINQASRSEHHIFYHCTVTPVTSDITEKEGDLNRRISQLRAANPHKIKQVRNELNGLFAVGELIDITDIISAATH